MYIHVEINKIKSMKQLENFDGVIYKIGCPSIIDSCIHSEPKFDKPRLFLGLVLNEI